MKIATFNVNGIRARQDALLAWLDTCHPDVLLLQEIKCCEEVFPLAPLRARGYHLHILGQKGYNGVATLSRQPARLIARTLPGTTDTQARFLEVDIQGLRLLNVYLPNGNPVGGDKFSYKLAWMDALEQYMVTLLDREEAFLAGGDFNVCLFPRDSYQPRGIDALTHPESRSRLRRWLGRGLRDAWSTLYPGRVGYTFWDYQQGRFGRNEGLRIDLFLLAPEVADRLRECTVDASPRGRETPSDHVPLVLELA